MGSYYLLKVGLVLHLIGISLLVGTTVANYMIYQQVWKLIYNERNRTILLVRSAVRLRMPQLLGALFILVGGVMMMSVYRGVVTQQTWFKIKMVVLLLILLNPLALGRPAASKLRRMLYQKGEITYHPVTVDRIRRNLNLYHLFQLLFFLAVFILSAFRIH
jgi:hypothetical protein